MSYTSEVIADSTGKWCGNAVRLASKEEARQYGDDLMWRWTAVREVRVVESTDPVNYRYINGKLERIENEQG